MRLLQRSNADEYSFTKDFVGDDVIPPYAILSHTWQNGEEVSFKEMVHGTGRSKTGYDKIQFCGQQAERDGLQYFWVDTCCIDQLNHVELQEAINSMFRWYQKATKCYVYLSDVSTGKRKINDQCFEYSWEPAFRESRWFTRGWTLQELLAPRSVEFFSREGKRLGDKTALEQKIHEITGIAASALQGTPLCEFTVEERFSWAKTRQTTRKEDRAYSLLGIFDLYMSLIYGEGEEHAFKRLRKKIDQPSNRLQPQELSIQTEKKDQECLQHLRLTDPRDDKKRIEETKGGLLKDSYHWIFENSDFQKWHDDQQSRLLWIKGDPGKGKTMLLCGIVNELEKSVAKKYVLSYFFCQATDSRINNATAVLRGLIYLLIDQQPSLVLHIRRKYDHAGKALFEDANAWVALSEIFTNILQDPDLNSTYLIIDALDECVVDLPKLLDFIAERLSVSSRIKCIVSSRNWPDIEECLERAGHKVRLCLELNAESISSAVSIFIKHKVHQLAERKKYNQKTRDAVLDYLSSHANDTFLWVALVCQNLEKIPRWNTIASLNVFPPGLDFLYDRMMQQICNSGDADLCKRILASIAIVYRPITLKELTSLIDILEDMADDLESLREIIGLCGSFLTIQQDIIYFVHQSAKDFLRTRAFNEVFPSGKEEAHYVIFSKSIQAMSRTLRRDMYSLHALGYPIDRVEQLDPDPLEASRYSCIYWVDHLCDWNRNSSANRSVSLQDGGDIDMFLRKKYLYWLEALSLCKSMSEGIVSMAKLEDLINAAENSSMLIKLVRDARRFIMYHKWAIEKGPLQAYASALLFSPAHSLIKGIFKEEGPKWITIQPAVRDEWGACLLTLESHSRSVNSVAFSYDNSARLASGSYDNNVKIWDASSGACLQTLKGHNGSVNSIAFSYNHSVRLASGSHDNTIRVWDISSGVCLQTLKGHGSSVNSVAFCYHDSVRLASGSYDNTIKIWDTSSGICLQTLKGHSGSISSVAFSYSNSAQLASGSHDNTVKIWDTIKGTCLTLEGHSNSVSSITFSHNSMRLASASSDNTIKIWDMSNNTCLKTFEGHNGSVSSVAFSHDSKRLASGSYDRTVKIWDMSSGACLQTLEGHSRRVTLVAFSYDSTRLASASCDRTLKIWDTSNNEYVQTFESHNRSVSSVAFSHDLTRLASASYDKTVKIWDTSNSVCVQTLEGHRDRVSSVAFSYDSKRLASGSYDNTAKIWDASSGACLQTLEINQTILSVSFDISGSCLYTDIGTIDIDASLISSTVPSVAGPQTPRSQNVTLSSDGAWITYKSEKLVWLPSEYRPSSSVVSGNMIGIGVGSGKVWICKVNLDGS